MLLAAILAERLFPVCSGGACLNLFDAVRARVRVLPTGAVLQLDIAVTEFPSVAPLPRRGGVHVDSVGRTTAATHQARKKAVDEGLEGWQRGTNDTDVTFNGRPDGSTVIVICDCVRYYPFRKERK